MVGKENLFLTTYSQFHQNFTGSFWTNILSLKYYKDSQTVSRDLRKKAARKMLVKLTST